MRIVLASASPRRSDLLRSLGLDFVVEAMDIDESELPGEDPVTYVRRVASEKAMAFAARPDDLVIAADTTVDVDGQILAKPEDEADARRMLRLISGRSHLVHTGVAVRRGGQVVAAVATTSVTVVSISDAQLDWYIGTGEPFGKAGAYALQGAAAILVDRVAGSVSNVIGLPLGLLDELVWRATGSALWASGPSVP
jgi:septum formation protein